MFFVWASIVCKRWDVGLKQKTLQACAHSVFCFMYSSSLFLKAEGFEECGVVWLSAEEGL